MASFNFTPTDNPNFDKTGRYSDIVNTVTPAIDNATKPYEKKLNDLGDTIQSDTKNLYDATMGQIDPTKDIYSAIAAELARTYNNDVNTLQTDKKATIGQQADTAAKQGFDSTSGFEAAQADSTKRTYDQKISDRGAQYYNESNQNAGQESKAILDLVKEANQAKLSGDDKLVQINSKLIDSKIQSQQIIHTAAQGIMNAETEEEKTYWENVYRKAQIDAQNEQLALEKEKFEYQKGMDEKNLAISQQNANTDQTYKLGTLKIDQQKANASGKQAVYEDNAVTRAAGLVGMPISQSANQKLALYQAKADKQAQNDKFINSSTTKDLKYDPKTGSVIKDNTNPFLKFLFGQ